MWKPIGRIDMWTWSLKLVKHNFSWLLHNLLGFLQSVTFLQVDSTIHDTSTNGLPQPISSQPKKMEHLGKLILKLATFSSNRKHLLTRMLQASCMLEGLISGKWLVGPRGALVHPRPPKFLKKINFFLELS